MQVQKWPMVSNLSNLKIYLIPPEANFRSARKSASQLRINWNDFSRKNAGDIFSIEDLLKKNKTLCITDSRHVFCKIWNQRRKGFLILFATHISMLKNNNLQIICTLSLSLSFSLNLSLGFSLSRSWNLSLGLNVISPCNLFLISLASSEVTSAWSFTCSRSRKHCLDLCLNLYLSLNLSLNINLNSHPNISRSDVSECRIHPLRRESPAALTSQISIILLEAIISNASLSFMNAKFT